MPASTGATGSTTICSSSPSPPSRKPICSSYAARLGLPAEPFAACLESTRHRDAVLADFAEGRAAGVRGTPTFFVNGRQLVGAQRSQVFQKAVQDALADGAGKQP